MVIFSLLRGFVEGGVGIFSLMGNTISPKQDKMFMDKNEVRTPLL